MANNDRVYEAYQGSMGEAFQKSTRKRIDWIIKQAGDAMRVLDIGCSQGVVSLMLASMGKQCIGIDVQPEAIDYANNLLKNEYGDIQNKVHFECVDVLNFECAEKFDCIIITEVIEHLQNPSQILRKASELLADSGIIIISTPFGLCPHPDHKATYYLSRFGNLLMEEFVIQKVDFVEQWMGTVCSRKKNATETYDVSEYLVSEENAFEIKEQEYVNRINDLRENLTSANIKYRQLTENYAILKENLENINAKCRQLSENYSVMKEWYDEKQKKLDRTLQELLLCYSDYNLSSVQFEQMMNRLIKLKGQNSTLIEENSELKRQLGIITNSKIGQIGIKVYQVYKRYIRKQ